jgi:hypothetical protein
MRHKEQTFLSKCRRQLPCMVSSKKQYKNTLHLIKKVKENCFLPIKYHYLASSYILTSGSQQNWQERRRISKFPNMNSLFDVIQFPLTTRIRNFLGMIQNTSQAVHITTELK